MRDGKLRPRSSHIAGRSPALAQQTLGVIVGTAIAFIFGGLWYGPIMGAPFTSLAYPFGVTK